MHSLDDNKMLRDGTTSVTIVSVDHRTVEDSSIKNSSHDKAAGQWVLCAATEALTTVTPS